MNLDQCASVWLEQLKLMLADHPDAYESIEKMAEEKRYKEAFTKAQDTVSDLGIKLNDGFKKADEDLYWLLV